MNNGIKTLIVGVVSLNLSISGFAQGKLAKRPNANAVQPSGAPLVPVREMIMADYVNKIPIQVELSDEQFARVLPFLRQWLQQRQMIETRRARSVNQLQQGINRGATDAELSRLTQEADQAENDRFANQQRFLTSVDPILNDRQKARLRVFLVRQDERIARLIAQSRNPATQQQERAAPTDKKPDDSR